MGPGDNFAYIKLIEDESMFMYMNYPVSVWLYVDSSPDKAVHGYTQQTSSALASEKGYVKWDLGGRKSKIIIIF